jgi:hypothetical protein
MEKNLKLLCPTWMALKKGFSDSICTQFVSIDVLTII